MKNPIIFLFLLISCDVTFSQYWDKSGDCNVNANDPSYLNLQSGRQGAISATVKLSIDGNCSGTLINRNTSDNDVGFYILTAKHCTDDVNFNIPNTIYFNYQSSGANDNSTAISNMGKADFQSTLLTNDGYEYRHQTFLRLVADYTWGDLALLEVLTPLPPHFNVTYAGWNPNKFNDLNVANLPSLPTLPSQIFGVHHPKGDIKKISGMHEIKWLETPVATGCYTITTVIDVLFGWLWGHRVSTKSICNYVDNPWIVVPVFQYGIVEDGSSGSGIFNFENKVFGVLSGGLSTCNIPMLEFYGKLHANYSKKSIKNTLNPSNDLWVDLFGLGERKITSYNNLILPGDAPTGAPYNVTGQYFPAKHYQANNKIVLQANNNIVTTQPITIFNGADYEFKAGKSITLGVGFSAQSGSNFAAKIEPANSLKNTKSTLQDEIVNKLISIDLPKQKQFDIDKYSKDILIDVQISEVYPNPNDGNFTIKISTNKASKFNIQLINMQGQTIYDKTVDVTNFALININKPEMSKGIFILKISNDKELITRKIIKE